ncbi:MAG TPA: SET domain-containing protein [Candidatus Nanoarchaeia archaeon]|nr:SET domain-containing protein [Candidatus Nanoarchaeia archaeon]
MNFSKEESINKRKRLLGNLKNTYCRLKPSNIEGVGVFAIRDIPQGVNPLPESKNQVWITLEEKELKEIPKEVFELINSFFVIEKNKQVEIPEQGLNGMDISFFVNHSKSPNLETKDKGYNFITLRKIKKGEELTVDYGTYDYKFK